jgi:hypothetical protein
MKKASSLMIVMVFVVSTLLMVAHGMGGQFKHKRAAVVSMQPVRIERAAQIERPIVMKAVRDISAPNSWKYLSHTFAKN